jgi:tetratricopeptide (TPR) repeat protein
MRFRKTIKVVPGIKLNISKSGVSTTVGKRGLSVNMSSRGTYLNTGIPGTGISSRRKISGGRSNGDATEAMFSLTNKMFVDADMWARKKSGYRLHLILFLASLLCAFISPFITILGLLLTIAFLTIWMSSDAGKSSANIRKARKAWQLMNYDKMIAHLEKAYALYPNPELLIDIAIHARVHKQPSLALKYLDKLEDNRVDGAWLKAECHFDLHNYKEAANYFATAARELTDEIPKDSLFAKMGVSLFNIGEYKQAIGTLQSVSEKYEDQSSIAGYIGKSFFELGEYESAILRLTNYIGQKRTFDENMIEMCYTLGLIYLKQNEKTKAKQWLNKVYARDIGYKDIEILLQGL